MISKLFSSEYVQGYTAALMDFIDVFKYIDDDLKHHKRKRNMTRWTVDLKCFSSSDDMMIDRYKIGNAMAACRKSIGLTQMEVANLLGNVDYAAISMYENGKIMPNLEKAIRMANVYGVTLDELVGREMKQDA